MLSMMTRRVSTPRGRWPGSRKTLLLRQGAGGAERPQQKAEGAPAWSEAQWLMRDSQGGVDVMTYRDVDQENEGFCVPTSPGDWMMRWEPAFEFLGKVEGEVPGQAEFNGSDDGAADQGDDEYDEHKMKW